MGKSKDLASGAAYQDQTESDTRYVNTAGDTMTGALTVGGNLTVNTDADTSIEFKDGGTNAAFMTAATGDELYIGANNEYAIRIKSDGTKDVAFDNGSRVTMPSQPSFSRRGQYGWQTKSSVDNIGSWYDGYDNTNMLNAGTGVATAPVAGKYMVSFLMYVNDTTTTAHYARPYVNGSVYKDAICYLSSNNGYDNTSGATWFINLGANDTVQWYHLGDIYGYHTWWNMHLLG